jgi:putative transposase
MGNAGREICRRAGISQAFHFNWNGKYDGPLPPETRPFEQFENENGKLRKLVVDLSCGREILRDVIRRKLWTTISDGNPRRRAGK